MKTHVVGGRISDEAYNMLMSQNDCNVSKAIEACIRAHKRIENMFRAELSRLLSGPNTQEEIATLIDKHILSGLDVGVCKRAFTDVRKVLTSGVNTMIV